MNEAAGAEVRIKCAIWARVSTEGQHTENQLHKLRGWAHHCNFDIAAEFVTEDSGWADRQNSAKGKEFEAKRIEMLQGLRHGDYAVILIWHIDRLSRRGSEDMQRYLRLLAEGGADVRADQNPWLNTSDPMTRELLIGIFATLAKAQSTTRSENIKLGLARRKREGKPVGGRKPGAKDKRKREHKTGQAAGWSDERRAALAERNRQRAQESAAG